MYGVCRSSEAPEPQSLEEQLYDPTANPCAELRKLNRSLLRSFLQLLSVMVSSPNDAQAKVADIRTLLLNMQHLINTFRPFEAREQLLSILQEQVDAKRRLISEIEEACTAAVEARQMGDGAEWSESTSLLPVALGEPADARLESRAKDPIAAGDCFAHIVSVLNAVPNGNG